jgi:hypothetical protein
VFGTSRATGFPARAITNSCPFSTRAKRLEKCVLAWRTLIAFAAFFMYVPIALSGGAKHCSPQRLVA